MWKAKDYESLDYDVRAVANEILKRAWKSGAKPTNMWLNKVTWFVYERMLVEFGKLLTPARVEAWDHGPVFREIYGSAKKFRDEPVGGLLQKFSIQTRRMEAAEGTFDTQTSSVIEEAIQKFGTRTASQLRNISHVEGSPWYRVWYSGQKTSAGMVISPSVIVAAAKARSGDND
jgi:uncharacterized phage-associated protein